MYYDVLVGGKYYHGSTALTYASDKKLPAGSIVRVPLRSRSSLGIVTNAVKKPQFKASQITESTGLVLPEHLLNLLAWLQDYYPAPLGTIVDLFLPHLPQTTPKASQSTPNNAFSKAKLPPLTAQQKGAIKELRENQTTPHILHGVTGSGKTRVYIERILEVLASGKSAIVLAPEIGLTQHLWARVAEVIDSKYLHVVHSGLSPKQRREHWLAIQGTDHPVVVIGARSALFSPVEKLGLVVVDEFHDSAYKQEQQPFYQTTRVAAQLTKLCKAQLILGSATPPVGDYYAFSQKKLPILTLDTLAVSNEQTPVKRTIVNLTDTSAFSKSYYLSTALLDGIDSALKNNEQSLLFLNRRGSARLILCDDCGWRAECPHCDIGMTYHGDTRKIVCHTCGHAQSVPKSCPECGRSDLLFTVAGTKTIEAELHKLFPHARIHRLDKDTATDQKTNRVLSEIESGDIDIIIGTQSITKGFDLPKLSIVGVIYADASLQIADYTATERTYQIISQVAGRLGRGHRKGSLVLQTYNPDTELLHWALAGEYKQFYEQEITHRQNFAFPPFQYVMKIIAKRASANAAIKVLRDVKEILPTGPNLSVSDPAPSYPEKVAKKYRWQLVVKSSNRTNLVQIAKQLPKTCSFDLDPNSLL